MCEKMQLVKHLGLRTPIILSVVHGVMGRDALTDEFREVWIVSLSFWFFVSWGKWSESDDLFC